MRKAKAKNKPPKKKSAPKTKRKLEIDPTLKARLEAEFAQAVRSAKAYVDDPLRLRDLFQDAAKAARSLPTDSFGDTWPYFQTMLRLIRGYYRGEYHEVTESTLVILIAAVIYVVSPLDVIPDAIPAIGFLDDATVVALAVQRTRQDLDDFMLWEIAAS
jgi:uncharacterized membrane protein YkvA (DUF1232 family)